MVEAISHLIHRDYEAIVEDFVTLQFIDPGTNLRPILPVLAKVSSRLCVLCIALQASSQFCSQHVRILFVDKCYLSCLHAVCLCLL